MDDNIQLLVETDREMNELIQTELENKRLLLKRAKTDAQFELKILEEDFAKKLKEEEKKYEDIFKKVEEEENKKIEEQIELFNKISVEKRDELVELIYREVAGYK